VENNASSQLITIKFAPRVSICEKILIPCHTQNSGVYAYLISAKPLATTRSETNELRDCCVVHFHGGGMISQSPVSHMAYLARWANALPLPFVSVDYRKAPEHPFPTPLEDCYAVYKWLLDNAHQLGISTKKVIIVGDSAGGNLAAGTVIKCIQEGVRVPNGLILVYPVTCRDSVFPARTDGSVSARQKFQNDFMLPYQFRQVYGKAYQGDNDARNPLLSPLLASVDVFSKFPKTHIAVGTQDPLYDDAILFHDKLVQHCPRPPVLHEFKGIGHGFLNFNIFMPNIRKFVGKAFPGWMKEMLLEQQK